MKKLICVIFAFSPFCWGYIPPAKMILERSVEHSGHGAYILEQEVILNSLDLNLTSPLVIKETWWIESEQKMQLLAQSSDWTYHAIYNGPNKLTVKSGKIETQRIPAEFPEKIFFYRQWDRLAQDLVQMGFLTTKNFLKKSNIKKSSDYRYEEPPMIRYGRSLGVTNYVMGPTPQNSEPNVGLWIEQDQFFIRKLIWPTMTKMTAEQFASFHKGLSFPKIRTLQWGQQTAQLKLVKITSKSQFGNEVFNPNQLKEIKKPIETSVVLADFYNRFR